MAISLCFLFNKFNIVGREHSVRAVGPEALPPALVYLNDVNDDVLGVKADFCIVGWRKKI